jgi:uncharacterized protein YndB with AHSA1/START domain
MATVDDAVKNRLIDDQVHTITIQATLERVWGEITRVRGIQKPMFNTVLETTFEPGNRMRYRSKDGKRVFIIGEVVDVQPPRRLAHTFRFTATHEEPTLVAWDLSEHADGVRVTVRHTHFSRQAVTHKSVLSSWPTILSNYKSVLERGDVPLGIRAKHALMQGFAFMMPSETRAEAAAKLTTSLPRGSVTAVPAPYARPPARPNSVSHR